MKKYLPILILALLFGCNQKKEQTSETKETKQTASSTLRVEPKAEIISKTYEGPLGLASGISIDELKSRFAFEQIKPGSHIYKGTPPRPIEGFEYFIAIASKTTGICKVIAKREYKNINGEGDQIKEAINRYKDLLIEKYGLVSDSYNFTKDETIDRNPRFWMMGLKEDTVFFSYFWNNKKNRTTPLPNQIESIGIYPTALSISSALVEIEYVFDNFTKCQEEFKKESVSQL